MVRDSTGSALPGVTVTVAGTALAAPRTVVTDERGRYEVDTLPAGRYRVTATLRGFEPWSTEIDVGAGAAMLDVVLSLSSFSERVTVTATKTGAADVQSTPVAHSTHSVQSCAHSTVVPPCRVRATLSL